MTFRKRHRLTSAQREQLWDDECAVALAARRGQFPICKLCDLPIFPGQKWHNNHDRFLPHAIGGECDGISHKRCNEKHNHAHDTPLVAKVKRIRRKHIGAWRPARLMLGSRDSNIKITMHSGPVDRRTGLPWHPK